MTKEKSVDEMNEEELQKFTHGKICEEPRCIRRCAEGYVICIQHLHGSSDVADVVYIEAKKRLASLRKNDS